MLKLVALVGVLYLVQACGCEVVDTGHRGVQTNYGKVVSESLDEGLHWYNPLTSNIVELNVQEQKFEKQTVTYTKDVQQAGLTYAVNYFPERTKIHLFYQNYGKEWEAKVIPQVVEGSIKSIVGKYEAVDLVSSRQEAVEKMEAMVMAALAKRDVTVTKLEITDIDFNDAFENAVEAKVVAVQKAEEAKNKTVQIQEEAEQKVISAKAEAESMAIRSKALSQNQALVEYEAVQKWNGQLPQYLMGNSVPFINLSKK